MILISSNPPSFNSTVIFLALASIEFSTNSLTTLAGLSITSPAAILLANEASKTLDYISSINFT